MQPVTIPLLVHDISLLQIYTRLFSQEKLALVVHRSPDTALPLLLSTPFPVILMDVTSVPGLKCLDAGLEEFSVRNVHAPYFYHRLTFYILDRLRSPTSANSKTPLVVSGLFGAEHDNLSPRLERRLLEHGATAYVDITQLDHQLVHQVITYLEK